MWLSMNKANLLLFLMGCVFALIGAEIFLRIHNPFENSSFDDIGNVVSVDPSLTTHLLKIVNSSFYSFNPGIETVNHALTIIGTQQLRELVLASSIVEKFSGISETLVDMKSFWSHSIGCGLAFPELVIWSHKNV